MQSQTNVIIPLPIHNFNSFHIPKQIMDTWENLPLSRIQEEGAEIGENNLKGQFHKTHVH